MFRDAEKAWCPKMVVLPVGSFTANSYGDAKERVELRHEVKLTRPYALGRYPVTRGQFAAFVAATGHAVFAGAFARTGRLPQFMAGVDGRQPGFPQTDAHPVVCVSWEDVQCYVRWLGEQTGYAYRLPTEPEWAYEAHGGPTTRFVHVTTICPLRPVGFPGSLGLFVGAGNELHHAGTMPVDDPSPPAKPIGLLYGGDQVWEWVQDCDIDGVHGATSDGHEAADLGDCTERVFRSCSWVGSLGSTVFATRGKLAPKLRFTCTGIRVARMLES